jgi:uncharacterized protein (DUF1499 family)
LKTLREEYQNKHVIKDSSDIDDIDLDALTPSQKTDLITRIDSLISEYQSLKDAIKDNERNDVDIKDLVEDYERQLAERISKLKRIKNKLNTTSVPVHNANYVQIKTQSENIRQDIDNKKINIRQAFDLVQATIRLAEDTLATDSTLTDDERATIENFRDG